MSSTGRLLCLWQQLGHPAGGIEVNRACAIEVQLCGLRCLPQADFFAYGNNWAIRTIMNKYPEEFKARVKRTFVPVGVTVGA